MLPATLFAQGCAMCKTALEGSEQGRLLAIGMNNGILFLMFTVYVIMGTLAYAVVRVYRSRK